MSILKWKAIGDSVIGSGHMATGKPCEDAVKFRTVTDENNEEALVCCVSDGAGSALFAAYAAAYCTDKVLNTLCGYAVTGAVVEEGHIFEMMEDIYMGLADRAEQEAVALNEYSCTLLGCYITATRAVFFQVGDGAIVRGDASGFYIPVWMPHNGEYQNSTSFLVDDRSFSNLKISIIEEAINEVALFSDGLQLLALNIETENVHQPFFTPLFRYLRMADDADKTRVLQQKLSAYLGSDQINSRTDDDKTLFLATRLC